MLRLMISVVTLSAAMVLVGCGGGSNNTSSDNGPGTDQGAELADVLIGDVESETGRDTVSNDSADQGIDTAGDGTTIPDGDDDTKPADVTGDFSAVDAGTDVQHNDVAAGDALPDVSTPCLEGDPCDDGNACSYGEKCSAAGQCVGGTTYACDDGRVCTTDTCDGKGNCLYVVKSDACLVNGVCRTSGETDPENTCMGCDPGTDQGAFVQANDSADCDPSASLPKCKISLGGTCTAGVCVTGPTGDNPCDDKNTCTQDSCDLETGLCVHLGSTGQPCVLEDRCKAGTCNQGRCIIPVDASCDDDNPCTRDSCDPANGCLHENQSDVSCDDNNACTVDDTCFAGSCQGMVLNCDDGNICTLDGCNAITACWHDVASNPCCEGGVSKCDDNNPCTNDDCTADGLGCINTANTAACNDGNPCTLNDSCLDKFCSGVEKNCNDGNSCTLDKCEAGKCIHTPLNAVPCDDGRDCSTGDQCTLGQCVADTTLCDVCTYTFFPTADKLVAMTISPDGLTGATPADLNHGLNLDDNASTCAPSSSCCCGIDNSLGMVAGLQIATDAITKAIVDGDLIMLFEHRGLRTDGGPYTLAFYTGKLDPANAACDYQNSDCQYFVSEAVFADWPKCNPLVSLDNAKIVGNRLTAGGKSYKFPFDLPLAGIPLHVDLYNTKVDATVEVTGGKITRMRGILGGSIPKQQIIDAINAIDPWTITQIDKETVLALIGEGDDGLVYPDLDADGDGVRESASIGIQFDSIDSTITGVF
jgi:hypothetical protein